MTAERDENHHRHLDQTSLVIDTMWGKIRLGTKRSTLQSAKGIKLEYGMAGVDIHYKTDFV